MPNDNRPTGLGALAQRVIMCKAKKEAADAALKAAKEELQTANNAMELGFAEQGVSSVKYRGHTVYAYTKLAASLIDGDKEAFDNPKQPALDALKANADSKHLVKETVNTNSLNAWVNEHPTDDRGFPQLPDDLKRHIKLTMLTRIGVSRSK